MAESGGNALVHIGTHRTGTTSFQRWASANRAELLKATGIHTYEGLFAPSHYELAALSLRHSRRMMMRVRRPDWCSPQWQADVEAHIRSQVGHPAASILISAEALSYLRHRDEIERLLDLLRPRRISALVVLRERSAFLSSYRGAMSGIGLTPSTDAQSFAYVGPDSWLQDYDALTQVYRDALGIDGLRTVGYEEALREHVSVIPKILATWGIDLSQVPSWNGYRDNATPPRGD